MISKGEVVKLYLPNHENLFKKRHRYVVYKNVKGIKVLASCTSDLMRAVMECGCGNYITAMCKNINALSPFELTTYILLNSRYMTEKVIIDRCLLTTPPKLYPEVEIEFMEKFKLVSETRLIPRDSFIKLNQPNVNLV